MQPKFRVHCLTAKASVWLSIRTTQTRLRREHALRRISRCGIVLLRVIVPSMVLCCRLTSLPISAAGQSLASHRKSSERPNIVLIMADDLGRQDLAYEGADLHETPHLDELCRTGMRFTQAYSPAPVCTPTRASLLTGKSPARLHMTIWSEGSKKGPVDRRMLQAPSLHDLPRTEITLARHLQAKGYLTASIGKWHLGEADYFPEAHGFDVNIGGNHWGAPATFLYPYRGAGRFGPEMRYVPHLEYGKPGEYLTDRLTDEAIRVIDHAAAIQQPFFLYVPHYAPHTPIEAKTADVEHFEKLVQPGMHHQNPVYAAMVRSLDESVGRIMKKLQEESLDDRTLVVFCSDNGGYIGPDRKLNIPVTNNYPLRSGKGSLYEGGIRVPLLVRWPGVTSAGTSTDQRVILTDLFPTLLHAASINTVTATTGAAAKSEEKTPSEVLLPSAAHSPIDGLNLTELMQQPATSLSREALYFHYPHYYHAPATTPGSAVIADNWKLIEYFEDSSLELYNLKDDPSEQHNLATARPEHAMRLQRQLQAWRESMGAALPCINPEYHETTTAEH